jgi:DNA anti-recombination protein RmuC
LKIKLVGCGYGDVVGALARQLNAASNSVDSLGKRTRVMSRKLKDVEVLSDQQVTERLLGLSGDDVVDDCFGGADKTQKMRIAAR